MKKLILTACVVAFTASVFAQGTIAFNNNITGTVKTRIYQGPYNGTPRFGNGTNDFPAGTTDWTGYAGLTGAGWSAVLLAATGSGVPESSLTLGATPVVTSFRSGANAGFFAVTTATLNQVAPDAAAATVEVFVWDNTKGGTDPVAALAAYRNALPSGTIPFWAGLSGAFNVLAIGGQVNSPPSLAGLTSFSIVPEPTTMALAGLAAASLLIFRRRK